MTARLDRIAGIARIRRLRSRVRKAELARSLQRLAASDQAVARSENQTRYARLEAEARRAAAMETADRQRDPVARFANIVMTIHDARRGIERADRALERRRADRIKEEDGVTHARRASTCADRAVETVDAVEARLRKLHLRRMSAREEDEMGEIAMQLAGAHREKDDA